MSEEKVICDKQSYSTSQEVNFAINGLNKRGIKRLYSYLCDECGLYHISSIKDQLLKKRHNKKDKNFHSARPITKKKFIPIKVTKEDIINGRNECKATMSLVEGLQRFIKKFKNKEDE